MEMLTSNLKSLVGSSKNGVLFSNLTNEYKLLTGQTLDYRQYHYNSLKELINDIDALIMSNFGSEYRVFLKPSNEDNMSQLVSLINCTKEKKSKSNRGNRNKNSSNNGQSNGFSTPINMYGGFNNKNFNNNTNYNKSFIKHNVDSYSNNQTSYSLSDNLSLDTLRISVPNDNSNKPNASSRVTPISQTNNSNSCSQNIFKLPNNNDCNNNQKNIFKTASIKNDSNYSDDYHEFNRNHRAATINNSNVVSDDVLALSWLCKPTKSYNPNKSMVRLIGIQTGIGFIKSATYCFTPNIVMTKKVKQVTPGDFMLWQSSSISSTPHKNPTLYSAQPSSTNDCQLNLNYTFLVVALTEPHPVSIHTSTSIDLDVDCVQVRLHGWQQLIDVRLEDLYEFPDSGDSCNTELIKLFKHIQTRQVTAVLLESVDTEVDIWDNIISNSTFASNILNSASKYIAHQLLASDSSEVYILENSEEPGKFLNTEIVLYFLNEIAPSFSLEKRKVLLKNVLKMTEHLLNSFAKDYNNVYNGVVVPVNPKLRSLDLKERPIPFDYITTEDDCLPSSSPIQAFFKGGVMSESLILIGSRSVFKNKTPVENGVSGLGRMCYSYQSKKFYYYDTSLDYEPEVNVELTSPIRGVYKFSDQYLKCTNKSWNLEKPRFQMALLQAMPSYKELKKILMISD